MTTPIDEMNDEDLNRAICERMGWKHVHNTSAWDHPEYGRRYDDSIICGIPNHVTGPTALDNMAKAEATLTDEERLKYWINVGIQVSKPTKEPGKTYMTTSDIDRMMAPARQRAIAWLKTKEAQA